MLLRKIKSILLAGLFACTFVQSEVAWSQQRRAIVKFSDVIEIPIIVTHIIPLDHVGFDVPIAGRVPVKIGMRQDYSDLLSGNNSLGRAMLMREVIATGDNQVDWAPSEFDRTVNSYRARSLYIIEYNRHTERFTVQENDEDCYIKQAGIGHLYERGTSATPTLPDLASGRVVEIVDFGIPPSDPDPAIVGPFDRFTLDIDPIGITPGFPPSQFIHTYDFYGGFSNVSGPTRLGTGCFRQSHPGGDGTCLTRSADEDQETDVPESLFIAPAEFDDAPPAKVSRFSRRGIGVVRLEMENNLPVPLFRIDVDWRFNIRFDFRGYSEGETPTYRIEGNHDLFPMFTVHLGDQLIYGYDGVAAGFGPLGLAFLTNIQSAPPSGLLVSKPFSGNVNLPIPTNIRQVNLNPLDPTCQ